MSYQILSLAIAEMDPRVPGEFTILGMEMKRKTICPFLLSKEDIIAPNGDIRWDLGRITNVGSVQEYLKEHTNKLNVSYIPSNCSLSESLVDLPQILEEKKESATDFFTVSNKSRYAIVKVSHVNDITVVPSEKYPHPSCKMNVRFQGSSRNESILNKDYRWVNYWVRQYERNNNEQNKAQFDESRKRYIELLNSKKKNLYCILYRHFFSDGFNIWIAGMHWL